MVFNHHFKLFLMLKSPWKSPTSTIFHRENPPHFFAVRNAPQAPPFRQAQGPGHSFQARPEPRDGFMVKKYRDKWWFHHQSMVKTGKTGKTDPVDPVFHNQNSEKLRLFCWLFYHEKEVQKRKTMWIPINTMVWSRKIMRRRWGSVGNHPKNPTLCGWAMTYNGLVPKPVMMWFIGCELGKRPFETIKLVGFPIIIIETYRCIVNGFLMVFKINM